MVTQDTSSAGVSFDTDQETRLILDSIEEFVEREVEPIEADLGETYTNPRLHHEPDGRLVDEVLAAIREVRRKSAAAGFYAMNLPEEAGGEGVSTVTWYRANRHVAAMDSGLSGEILAGPEGPKPLLAQATGDQREEYLMPVVRAAKSTAFAQTEPGVGSDSPNMSTTATKEGDEWVLNGEKQWITNAPYADFVQVFARTTPQEEAGRYGGITCLLVERGEYEIGALNNAVGSVGRQAEIRFDDVGLPESRILGEVDEAFYDAMGFLSLGRLELGAQAIGASDHLLDRCVEYAREREAFGNPIGEFQQISATIARGRAKQYAADAAGLRCAWRMDRGKETIEDASILKWFATNAFWKIADDAVGIYGASGLAEENPFMHYLHTARILRIVEGTDEIQLNTIAKRMGVR